MVEDVDWFTDIPNNADFYSRENRWYYEENWAGVTLRICPVTVVQNFS